MTERVQAGGLQVAEALHRFVERGGAARDRAWTRRRSGTAPARSSTTSRRATASCWPAARRSRPASTSSTASTRAPPTPRPTPRSCARSATCSTSRPTSSVTTDGVDDEVARIAGPQLVVPLLNARFATNAANARWGSLYDALYGTDVVPHEGDLAPGDGYNKVRGDEVIRRGRALLDESFPLAAGSHADATAYAVDDDGPRRHRREDDVVRLADPAQLVGFRGDAGSPEAVLLAHHGLHVEIQVDRRGRDRLHRRAPASRTCCSSPRSPRSWTSRTPSRRSTPRTRCSATATGCS